MKNSRSLEFIGTPLRAQQMNATRVGRIGLPPVQVGLTNELVYLVDKYGVKKSGVEAWV